MSWLPLVLLGCGAATPDAASAATLAAVEAPDGAATADPFATFLGVGAAAADGFSAPLDAGWSPCGEGCWTAATERPVRSMAAGRVVRDGEVLRVEHRWYENATPSVVRMRVTGARAVAEHGATVARGDTIAWGTRVELVLEGRDEAADVFAAARPWLPVPQAEPHLALVSHDADELRTYADGVETGRYQVGFGQAEGAKVHQGDNRTPKGVYYIVQHSRGPFGGPSADYFGGAWMRVNYPNAWDAARAVDEGWIDVEAQRRITRTWRARKETPKTTRLGGGIGLHGWAWEWDDADPRGMSWGCVVMHLRDIDAIMAALPTGSMIVLF